MRIGVVTSSFPRSPGDHAGSFVLELCKAHVERGHTLEVIAPDPGSGSPPAWPGIDVIWARYGVPRPWQQLCYGAGMPDNIKSRPWLAMQAPWLGAALAHEVHRRSKGWDGVISHWLLPSGLATSWAGHGLPHVAVAHSGDVWLMGKVPALGAAVMSQIARGATSIGVVNPTLGDALEKLRPQAPLSLLTLGPDRLQPAQPAVSEKLTRRLEAQGIASTDVTALTIARLVPVKGVDVLLRALARAKGISAIIAGDGPERGHLEALARSLKVKVAFIGAVEEQERAALLEGADLLVVPSRVLENGRSEGTPIAAIEGMAAGLPIVASDVGGLSWALGDAGLLCEPGSEVALAEALSRLRDDDDLRALLAREGKQQAQHFGWPAAAEHLEDLLTGVKTPSVQ